jgi:hypothetical protein
MKGVAQFFASNSLITNPHWLIFRSLNPSIPQSPFETARLYTVFLQAFYVVRR